MRPRTPDTAAPPDGECDGDYIEKSQFAVESDADR